MGQCENTYSMTSSGAICAPSCEFNNKNKFK